MSARENFGSHARWGAHAHVDLPGPDSVIGVLGPAEYPGDPGVFIVSLGLDWDRHANWTAGDSFGRAFQLVGIIKFGSGRARQEIELDWTAGVQVAVPANSLSVSVKRDPAITSPLPLRVQASVVVARGTGIGTWSARRTILARRPEAGPAIVAVPAFAKAVTAFSESAVELALKTGPEAGDSALWRSQGATPLPIVAPGRFVEVAGTFNHAWLSFQLAA